MLTSLLATFTIYVLLVVSAAPLGMRGSVGYNASEKHIHTSARSSLGAQEATLPPSRAASYVEMKLVQPTPPPWRGSVVATEQTAGGSSRKAGAPGWRALPVSSILERAAQPTPAVEARVGDFALPAHTEMHTSAVEADAPGWKKRATDGDTDPTVSQA
ncbi:hypothetical protein C8R45DRAFT_929158 [Mycena sanguinolenta]|nr:hypothetical protein C8R45DRAFT_929158 [Mycena sanguinolenta]